MADHDTHDHTGVTGVPSSTAPNPTTIELGHASDTTLSRASAGVVAVEGTNLVKAGAATGSGLTMATARLLGRTTASSGAIEEISVGTGLSLAAGSLSATGSASPIASGTSFPGSPSTNDIFLRTDLDCLIWIYNGTRWLCTTLHEMRGEPTDSLLPYTATLGAAQRMIVPNWGGSDIWLVDHQAWFFVVAGTALSASHKWVITGIKQPAGTTIVTINIDSGASSAHRQSTRTAIDALLTSTNFEIDFTMTKTGTPGNLYAQVAVTYRHVAT